MNRNISAPCSNTINHAARWGYVELVIFLLNIGMNPNERARDFHTPLTSAVRYNKLAVVEVLLKAGADVNKPIGAATSLFIASHMGYVELVKLLIKAGAEINKQAAGGKTPLYIAVKKGHHQVVKLLLDAGADVNIPDKMGRIPLFIAIIERNDSVIKLLLEACSDVNHSCLGGWTPLHVVAMNGLTHVVELLIKSGANINLSTTDGWTPLLVATAYNHVEVVAVLFEEQADTNPRAIYRGYNPTIPLWYSVEPSDTSMVRLCALDLAYTLMHEKCIRILASRKRMAGLRIWRFLRDTTCNPMYASCRRRLTAECMDIDD